MPKKKQATDIFGDEIPKIEELFTEENLAPMKSPEILQREKDALMKKINSYKALFPQETDKVEIDDNNLELSLVKIKNAIDGRNNNSEIIQAGNMVDRMLLESYKFSLTPVENLVTNNLINCKGFVKEVCTNKNVKNLTKKIIVDKDLIPLPTINSSNDSNDVMSLLILILQIFVGNIIKNSCMSNIENSLNKQLKDKYKDI